MLIAEHPPHAVDGLDLLAQAVDYAHGALGHVTAQALGRATPCRGWDLETLLRHMDDALTAFTDAAEIGYVEVRPAVAVRGTDPASLATGLVRRLEHRARVLVAAWRDNPRSAPVFVGDVPLSRELVAIAGALEITVHGWDVARSCDLSLPIPATLARDLLDVAPSLVSDADRPARFAGPVAVPPGAGGAARLLGFLGRG